MLKDAQFTASIDFDAAVIWPSEVGHHSALHGAETLSRQQSHADHRYPLEGSSRRNTAEEIAQELVKDKLLKRIDDYA